jgi:hypothetical protein
MGCLLVSFSCRKLAAKFKVSKDTVQRILAQADVRPHRWERYMASDDPDFEAKAADVIGLYLALPSTPPCSASMKRLRFKRWTVDRAPGRRCGSIEVKSL